MFHSIAIPAAILAPLSFNCIPDSNYLITVSMIFHEMLHQEKRKDSLRKTRYRTSFVEDVLYEIILFPVYL